MNKLFAIIFISAFLSGCMFVHKMDIEQGNVFSTDMVQQLHRGMTRAQVKEIMGSCILLNTFDENRLTYVYTFKPGGGRMVEKQVTIVFSRNIVRDIIVNNYRE